MILNFYFLITNFLKMNAKVLKCQNRDQQNEIYIPKRHRLMSRNRN